MAPPASKRQKRDHLSSDDEEDEASFASFPDDDDDEAEEHDGEDASIDGGDGEAEELDIEEDDDGGDDDSTDDVIENGAASHSSSQGVRALQTHAKTSSSWKGRLGAGEAAYTAGTFKSSMFKLQVDELLEQIRPRRGKAETSAEAALHELRKAIEQIPAREPLTVDDAERRLLKEKVSVPFPNPRPSKDAQYKLAYAKPANINVVGSYALKTSPRGKGVVELDMIMLMPLSLFQEKDYLDYRYYYRRSYYLACIAAGLRKSLAAKYVVDYQDWHGNPLKPVLVVRPAAVEGPDGPQWKINLIPCIADSLLSADKLSLDRNCVRSRSASDKQTQEPSETSFATPFYNSSLRADMLVPSYLKTLHASAKSCQAFNDACLLGTTWLRQRSFGSDISAGGFGGFEWSALMAALLEGGGPTGRPILSNTYSSYQLIKATLQLLAVKDLSKQPLLMRPGEDTIKPTHDGTPVIWDSARAHNLLFKMTASSYKLLRHDARTTISTLGDQQFDGFEATFILRGSAMLRFDTIAQIQTTTRTSVSHADTDPSQQCRRIYQVLTRALGDRVRLVHVAPTTSKTWPTASAKPKDSSSGSIQVGFLVNPDTVNRTVDHGPPAENKSESASYRSFWGEKAELRRFKDGSIMESLVWSARPEDPPVIEQIVGYIIGKHFEADAADNGVRFYENDLRRLVARSDGIAAFSPFMDAYRQLENDIRGLDDLPLSIRQIAPADALLRYSSIELPLAKQMSRPADVVLQFEGSARWPDDLVAIQRTKIAFLLMLSELLQRSNDNMTARVGLENAELDILNQAFLEITYDSGASFRIRILHDRQQTLLERQLKDKALDQRSKEIAAVALARYKRDYLKAPAHTQAIARLCSRHPALSGTIRLMKQWIASHLLTGHIAEEVVELLAARTFVQPWPWQTPSSVKTGFLRTLSRLARWDWRAEPLIVDLSGSGELKPADAQACTAKFEAWRKLDPALNRVVLFAASNVDGDGTSWTDGQPAKVVASRLTALARAAVAEMDAQGSALQLASLFASPLTDFDFTIHLDPDLGGRKKARSKTAAGKSAATFKNLRPELQPDDPSLVGFDPLAGFVDDLNSAFGSAVLFFSGGRERPVIAGLWRPQTAARPWRLNMAYSTVPRRAAGSQDEDVEGVLNKDAIFAEIARLGGDLIERIDVKGK